MINFQLESWCGNFGRMLRSCQIFWRILKLVLGVQLGRGLAGVFLFVALSIDPGVSREFVVTTPDLIIDYRDIQQEQAKNFAIYTQSMLSAITAYLNRPVTRTIRISIADQHVFPNYDKATNRIVVPANRIRGDAPGPPHLRGRGSGITLILSRVVAPSNNPLWKKFLEMGLGTYLQERFGAKSDRSYPAMGRDLHEATVQLAASYGRYIPLAEAEAARTRRTRLTRTRQLAYLQEGSFVRHLIETHGLAKFLELYEGSSYKQTYGRDLAELEQEWLETLKTIRP